MFNWDLGGLFKKYMCIILHVKALIFVSVFVGLSLTLIYNCRGCHFIA